MKIPVLIEPLPDKGFRAKCGEPFLFVVEAPTRHDALRQLELLIQEKLRTGEVFALKVSTMHPSSRYAGSLDPDDPTVQEWQAAIQEYRRQKDEEEEMELS